MLKRIGLLMMAGVLAATIAEAQEKKAAVTKTEQAAPKPAPEPQPLPVNIKIEVSITDQTGNNPPAKKVVTMIASDRLSANVRSSASVPVKTTVFGGPANAANIPAASYSYRNVTINVDARPAIVAKEPNKISLSFGLEYLPKTSSTQEEMEPGMTSWSEKLSLILESGKPMIISQAADPTSDRKITVEITATILK
jgi:hypothetical protein